MKKIKVFLRLSQVANCGVGYYRQYLPLKKLEEKGLIELKVMDYNGGKEEIKEPFQVQFSPDRRKIIDVKYNTPFFKQYLEWADIVYMCRDESPGFLAVMGGARQFFKKPFLADIDDYVQFTRPHNPGYLSFNPYSVFNDLNFCLLNNVDGITVSTEYLKEVYKNENKKIFVCPNSIDVKMRDKVLNTPPQIKKKKDEIRIGWAGSSCHYENLKQLINPLRKILAEFPNTTFHYTGLFGDLFNWPEFKGRIETVKFVNLDDWPKKLKGMGLDIALAPLCDNHFNRAKSNLRVLEYWSAKYPVIASPILPYKFIKNGKDGLLAMEENEWYDAIKSLVLDEKKRNSLAEKGYERLNKEFNIDKNCLIWYNCFRKFI